MWEHVVAHIHNVAGARIRSRQAQLGQGQLLFQHRIQISANNPLRPI